LHTIWVRRAAQEANRAIGVRVGRPAVIRDNVFIGCGYAAIALYWDPDRVSIDRNLFYLTPRDVVNSRISGQHGRYYREQYR